MRSRTILLALIIVAMLQAIYFYPQLPDTLASHFGGDGQPNGWASKPAFFLINFAVVGLTVAVFWALPLLFQRLPLSWINLPNKHYWLAEERREASLRFIRQQMGWFGVASLLLYLGVIQLAIWANLGSTPALSVLPIVLLLGAYYLFVILWLIHFYRKFRRTP